MNGPEDLARYRGFLVDVDGVVVRDRTPLPGALAAVRSLQARGPVLFLSNNATLTRAAYAEKLAALGLRVAAGDVLNSAYLAARYLAEAGGATSACVVGETGLRRELEAAGHRLTPDGAWLVTGMDRALDYAKLARGLQVLLRGGRWIATNADGTYPARDGLMPGAGSVVGAFRGMGFEPEQIAGKPSRYCMDAALALLGLPREVVLLIGDRLDSDVAGASEAGVDSLLVLSGVTDRAGLARSPLQPTYVLNDLAALVAF